MVLLLDIGKTNKKCFVFDEAYRIIFEKTTTLPETVDEDGDPCEDLGLLKNWALNTVSEVLGDPQFHIRAINCTTYGASFVHLDADGQPLTPLYNYLKPFPEDLKKQFFETYGGEEKMALETASPVLGNLNSGLQLYGLKHRKPLVFKQIKWSLHLPQYVAFLVMREWTHSWLEKSQAIARESTPPPTPPLKGRGAVEYTAMSSQKRLRAYSTEDITAPLPFRGGAGGGVDSQAAYFAPDSHNSRQNLVVPTTELTSIGCHTMLWDFQKTDYHDWVKAEGILEKFPPIYAAGAGFPANNSTTQQLNNTTYPHIGIGLHDSSAALIPYLAGFSEPFVLLSTGTWCISLNPFNHEPLTPEELRQDCLCYLTFEGKPVKAARYFGGYEHEQAVKNIAGQFGVGEDFYQTASTPVNSAPIAAYLDFMRQLVKKQVASTRLAIGKSAVQRIFVDGGFSKNNYYMTLLAESFPDMEVYAAEVAQATALGAALAIHASWSTKPIPRNLISLKKI